MKSTESENQINAKLCRIALKFSSSISKYILILSFSIYPRPRPQYKFPFLSSCHSTFNERHVRWRQKKKKKKEKKKKEMRPVQASPQFLCPRTMFALFPLNAKFFENRIKSYGLSTYGKQHVCTVCCHTYFNNCYSRFRPTWISVTSIKTRRTWRPFCCTGTRMGKCSL